MKLFLLQDRSFMLRRSRDFFHERGLWEVDSPSLLSLPSLEACIDLIETKTGKYLHSSPEYHLKKLLSQGSSDLYFLGHVFREEEEGRNHSCEFTMVEWYRKRFSLEQMQEETYEYLSLFLPEKPLEKISYEKAFITYLGIDPFTAPLQKLQDLCEKKGLVFSGEGRDFYLQLLLTHCIEPKLPRDVFIILEDFPPSQAALAKVMEKDKKEVALRFEVYYNGLELANGYEELTDASVQRARFFQENKKRASLKKALYPIDEAFLDSLKKLPPCSGVSVGFDRALMLRNELSSIQEVLF